MMNALINMQDQGFAIIFAVIVMLAAVPKGYEYWQKMQKDKSENEIKLKMLKMGSSVDEIERTFLSQNDCDSRIQRA